MAKIDLKALETALKNLSNRSKLYKLLKTELTKQGHWKLKARGKPNIGSLKGA